MSSPRMYDSSGGGNGGGGGGGVSPSEGADTTSSGGGGEGNNSPHSKTAPLPSVTSLKAKTFTQVRRNLLVHFFFQKGYVGYLCDKIEHQICSFIASIVFIRAQVLIVTKRPL